MSLEGRQPDVLPVSATWAQLRRRKLEATQALLGDTIAISDEAWQRPSLLLGWTRAHVATHLARNADGLARVVEGLLSSRPARMYRGERERRRDLELGSRRKALDLQIDLDTSAGALNRSFTRLDESGAAGEVELSPGRWLPVHHLPVARLAEVVLHHVDLDCGFTIQHVDTDLAHWLLEWVAMQINDRADFPAMLVSSTSGFQARLGSPHGPTTTLHGSDADLLGFLTSRAGTESMAGAAGLVLPKL